MIKDNPLLDLSGPHKFDQILPEHIEPAVDSMLQRNRTEIARLIEEVDAPTWENFMSPLELLEDELERVWAPVSHLSGVKDSDALRDAYEACLPKLSDYATEMGQNRGLFEKLSAIRSGAEYKTLNQAQRKALDNALRDFRLSGIDLEPDQQKRFGEISSELSRLSNAFARNVQDATDNWSLDITDQAYLRGIPENAIAVARQTAEEAGRVGWRFTLQGPSYIAVMTYADDPSVRERMYRAFVTRASEVGPNAGKWDNSEVMGQILNLRQEQAKLLGFEHYGALSLEPKMADSSEEVFEFLDQLADRSTTAAENEVAELRAFARDHLGMPTLSPWDYGYVSEKLRQHRYDFSQEVLRPYFPLPRVLEGMFAIVGKLFGIRVEEAPRPPVWDDSVQYFSIRDDQDNLRGYFYVDLYSRPHKRGGAWMADYVGRRQDGDGVQLPVAFLTCNFSRPVGDQPSLLTHDNVITLFHEFGHGLHHMLTKVNVGGVSGLNGVPWDAVELPSQFLENWCWEREALDLISGHIETGQPLPGDLLEKMRAGRNFQSAMQMCRQLEFSQFDMRIHTESDGADSQRIQSILDRVRDRVAVVEAPEYNRFQHAFDHIFSGGYAAGYYSYKWAEVLSADAYSKFEENGIFDSQTGRQFLSHILEKGGSEEPMALFEAFRGRKPSVEPLLRHSGLSQMVEAA